MKKTLLYAFFLLFVSHNTLIANEDINASEEIYEEAVQDENTEKPAKVEATDEELEAKRLADEAAEIAHAEEIELREVGAGEEPVIEE